MLTYDLSKREKLTIYEYLYKCIKQDILEGELKAHERLPSKREFAKHHQISLKSVENAYDQLLTEGYIYSEEKRGYFVMPMGHDLGKRMAAYANHMPFSVYQSDADTEYCFADFTSNQAAIQKFPFGTWAKIMRNVLADKEEELLKTVPFQGIFELRQAIAKYLYGFRGMQVSPDQIIIGAGTEYLYGRLIQLLGRDKIYAVEDPGYSKITKIYHANGVSWEYIDVDENGMQVEKLHESKADVVHVSPGHHFPTGSIMPIARRNQLLEWAQEERERHIHRMKKYYKEKRDRLLKVVEESQVKDYMTIDEKDAGNHFLMKFNTSLSDTELKWFARENGIRLDCLSEYCVKHKEAFLHTIIVNYSDLEGGESFKKALEILADVIIR